ncbi:hypothetical protein Tco_0882526, partial [Tanacetum coccineum]
VWINKNHKKIVKNGQAWTRESEVYKAEARKAKTIAHALLYQPQGPILQIPKVIYNLKKGKERKGPNVQIPQSSTVLTVEN